MVNKFSGRHYISLKDVSFNYGLNTKVLNNISFALIDGSIMSIVGPSGCGKSTLLRLIAGLLSSNSGKVYLNGKNPEELQKFKKIGISFQDSCLIDWLSVKDNILLPTKIGAINAEEQRFLANEIDSIIHLIKLTQYQDYFPNQLSGGMKQRVSFARALISNPDILLLDEPFSALDSVTKITLMIDFSKILAERNLTTVFITHDIEEAVFLSDKIIFLSQSPATIIREVEINLNHPRSIDTYNTIEFEDKVKLCRKVLMTNMA